MNPPWRARTAADVPPAVEEAARMTTLPDMPREGGGGGGGGSGVRGAARRGELMLMNRLLLSHAWPAAG